MTEIKLVGKLLLSVLLQIAFIPFKLASFACEVVEKVGKISKETINNFIKIVQSEVKK